MHGTSLARLACLVLPGLVGCSFVLDFDGLTGGEAGDAGSGGSSGSGGKSGGAGGDTMEAGAGSGGTTGGSAGTDQGGEGGAAECPPACDDGNPCTDDGCTTTGACTHDPVTGIVLDGVDRRIPAERQFRVTMASASDAFFLSSLSATSGVPAVTFYRLSATQDDFEEIATLDGLDLGSTAGTPLSAAGLVIEPSLGLLHGFVALQDRTGTGSRVWHVVLDMSFTPRLRAPVGPSYWTGSPYNYPVAALLNGNVYTAWITEAQTITLAGGALDLPATLSADTPATTLALFGTAANQPAVLYTVAGGGVFAESPMVPPFPVSECQTAPGDYLSSSVTDTTIQGFWIASWTKYAPSGTDEGWLTTDGRAIGCSATACAEDDTTCSATSASNLVRNPATLAAVRPGDPTGVVSLVQAVPVLGIDDQTSQPTASLLLVATRVDFGRVPLMDDPVTTPLGDPVFVSGGPTAAPDFKGPDWPALAFVPPDRLALSFIEPGSGGDDLRVQRYRVCLPPP